MSNQNSNKTRPGFKTTEFYFTLIATLIGLLMASGVIEAGSVWDKAVGMAAMVLASMGYSTSRGKVKAAEASKE